MHPPKTVGSPFLLESGELETGPRDIAILLPWIRSDPRKKAYLETKVYLETWRGGTNREQTELQPGLVVIHPGVCYEMSSVPFVTYVSDITPVTEQQ